MSDVSVKNPGKLRRCWTWLRAHPAEVACGIAMALACWAVFSPVAGWERGATHALGWLGDHGSIARRLLSGSATLLGLAGGLLGPAFVLDGLRRAGWTLAGVGLGALTLQFGYLAVFGSEPWRFGILAMTLPCALTLAVFYRREQLRDRRPVLRVRHSVVGAVLLLVALGVGRTKADPVAWGIETTATTAVSLRLPGWGLVVRGCLAYDAIQVEADRWRSPKLPGAVIRTLAGSADASDAAWAMRFAAEHEVWLEAYDMGTWQFDTPEATGPLARIGAALASDPAVLEDLLRQDEDEVEVVLLTLRAITPQSQPGVPLERLQSAVQWGGAVVAGRVQTGAAGFWLSGQLERLITNNATLLFPDGPTAAYDLLQIAPAHFTANFPGRFELYSRDALLAELPKRDVFIQDHILMAIGMRRMSGQSYDVLDRVPEPDRAGNTPQEIAAWIAEYTAWAKANVPK